VNKLFKTLLTLAIVIGLLFVAAVVILPKVIDPNNYKDKITSLVQEKTGMELVIDGDIDLSFYPWLGLKTGQLILSDPALPDSPALMQVSKAVARIKLLPLLKKQVELYWTASRSTSSLSKTARPTGTNWPVAARRRLTSPQNRKTPPSSSPLPG